MALNEHLTFEQALRLHCFALTRDVKRASIAYDYILNGTTNLPADDRLADPYNALIDNEGLSLRARNLCEFPLEVTTVGELAECQRGEVTKIHGLGAKTFEELDSLIRKYGLTWGHRIEVNN